MTGLLSIHEVKKLDKQIVQLEEQYVHVMTYRILYYSNQIHFGGVQVERLRVKLDRIALRGFLKYLCVCVCLCVCLCVCVL